MPFTESQDTNLPEHGELFELLRNMTMHMVEVGYVPILLLLDEVVRRESVYQKGGWCFVD